MVNKVYFLIFLFVANFCFSQNESVTRIPSSNTQKTSIYSDVTEFGAVGDGKTDDTKAIQKAINTGKPLKFPPGVFAVSTLKLPYGFRGLSIQGAGYNHWSSTNGTVLKAVSTQPILSPENGCDFVKISDIRFEGNNISNYGFDGKFGAAFIFSNVGFYNFSEVGLRSRQGLLRIDACFFSNNKIGVELFSDSTLTNSEIVGKEIGLSILSGGNRISNLWVNGASKNSILISPLDTETNLQNISLNNLYIEDVIGEKKGNFQIVIKGNKVKRVQQVRISNSFFAHATKTKQDNSFIYLENADEVILSNNNFLGQHTYFGVNNFTDHFVYSLNSNNIKIVNNIIKGINNAAIVCDKSYDWSIMGNDFIDCGGLNENQTIKLSNTGDARFLISNNRFVDYRAGANTYAVSAEATKGLMFVGNYLFYPSLKIVESPSKEDFSGKNFR